MKRTNLILFIFLMLIISGCAGKPDTQEYSGSAKWGRLPPCDYNFLDSNFVPGNKKLGWVPGHLRNCEFKDVWVSNFPDTTIVMTHISEIGIYGQLDGFQHYRTVHLNFPDMSEEENSCHDHGLMIATDAAYLKTHSDKWVSTKAKVIKACKAIRSVDRLAEFLAKECSNIGLKVNTSDYNQCLIQLRVGILQKPASTEGFSAQSSSSKTTPSTSDRLEGIAQILNAFRAIPANAKPVRNSSNSPLMTMKCRYKAGLYEWSEVTDLTICPPFNSKGGMVGSLAF